ncbi:ADP-forming succinate--CoA ligase subunit beta [Tuwongella immobilis]|uniref:Succinate--CoA ligase [ADP-forming] subunit beta n=1 Tax=Tuwongella immobilis TaxID=692036 RepID=A0A6C2YSW7_9BACT|nr:ADP-forming succinate--CoA ligase subunit beta [Tuwongella immobilis]VIP04810.1 succinyl- synthetase subunit beta : Succinyl-CoA ligase [ADP-forming] subunit beta OS=Planctomyces maris DSM 8797 GN=sucC PE=3 SV=1: ATP-grasp_2: Ligase_CoA [Tuwongella immobilis]VTS06980.1 succinyl- synthetase subunit beta : Succinyl-CoA ligase [ADP-forming] subunit beta OS=Planctomyces maris DSM 8797 GN=sucC PE=3 SV=1: ATP-grasp_2: Ligase_CoA [Tuwongella immobilis]
MKIHEYQAKELFAAAGAAVPKGIVVHSVEEALKAFDDMGGKPVVLKAQIHAGGRGKGTFLGAPEGSGGGVKYTTDREKIAPTVERFLKYPLQTIQTGPEGQKVSTILVQQAADIAKEYYLAMVLDRTVGGPVLMASTEGGMDIEEVAHKTPEKILKLVIDVETGLPEAEARKIAEQLGFTGTQIDQAVTTMKALTKVFMEKDCSLAEINPLAVTPTGEILVLDAKVNFDDNALFRHSDVAAMRDITEENPAELRAAKSGLSFIQLDGNIGCLVNGAGLAMGTMDIIKYHGGDPANFLDVGGGANKDQVTEAFRILLGDPNVKAVLVNIFGGIMQCDTIAEAILAAFKEVGFHVPLVVRLQGTNVEKGRKILADSGLNIATAEGLTEAAQKVVAAAKGA